jgi:transcriptional regulator GlxA family with amidase domain
MRRNLAIFVFDDVTELDFCGPFEVFAGAGRREGEGYFNVYTVAEKPGPIVGGKGLSVNPAYTFANCPKPDILLIPGGRGARREMNNPAALDWIRGQYDSLELMLSVCTGALVLAKAGLLEGLAATTHFRAVEELRAVAPNTTLRPEERYIDNGKIILSAGVSAGIDMSLYVIARLYGADKAAETAQHIQYDYWPVAAQS